MSKHDLKTWPEFFADVVDGFKTFEIRKNDRDFKVGDILNLREWSPDTSLYTGQSVEVSVSYILEGGQFGIEPGYVVMAIHFVGA